MGDRELKDADEAKQAVMALHTELTGVLEKHLRIWKPKHSFIIGGRAVNGLFAEFFQPSISWAEGRMAEKLNDGVLEV
jgi:hypothetical protein